MKSAGSDVLAKVNSLQAAIATADNVVDCRKLIALAEGLLTAGRRVWREAERMAEAVEDRERLFSAAVKAGELRLLAEVRLGELLEETELPGRGGGDTRASSNGGTRLKDLGLTKQDSHRAQTLARHKDLIPVVIKEAVGRRDVPTRRDFERLFREGQRQTAKATPTPLPPGVYNVIYADPPWQYQNSIDRWGPAGKHYQTMSTDDLCGLPGKVGLKVADNAVLFLWATNPFLPDALRVVGAWGFQYKTNLVWVKTELQKPGSGFYVRGRHELLFVSTRGSFTPRSENISPPIGSVIEAPVREHSRKPAEVYGIIERLYPSCNYIELFARERRKGWESWGDEL